MTNKLFYGDNLEVLRESIADASVDLVYLDPPFNSNANYNILFKARGGGGADAQIEAFEDTWHWNEGAEDAFDQVARSGNTKAFDLLNAMRGFLGDNDMMAYLAMMAVRLIELHRVLKPTGSLYLHCDPTASHYLKLLLDGVFGAENYRNEIIWKRTTSHNDAARAFPDVSDTIFFYTRSAAHLFNRQYTSYDQSYLTSKYRHKDASGRVYRLSDLRSPSPRPNLTYDYKGFKPHPNGWAISREKMEEADRLGLLEFPKKPEGRIQYRRYLDERAGMPVTSVWDDVRPINSMAQERLGYPTQKPLALLERIIAASSNPGDVVLDPFCGCGTAVHAAEKLDREWIGIDVTHLAISLIEKRMNDAFADKPGFAFTVEGTPKDLASAEDLASRDKYQFQWWAVSMVDALPFGGKKKGADGGIDGIIYFSDYDAETGKMKTHRAIVSVKGGLKPGVAMVETLAATIERERAPIGVLIMNALPTREMEKRAAAVGVYRDGVDDSFPRLQIITLAELFRGKRPRIPNVDRAAFKRARREEGGGQERLI